MKIVSRPPGLTIAILGAAVFYGVIPLILFYLAYRLDPEEATIVVGGNLLPFDFAAFASATAAIGVLITAILAWMNRIPHIHYIFQAMIIISAALLTFILLRLISPEDALDADQIGAILSGSANCQMPFHVLVLVYILWYLNRAPARAFFVGTPLHEEDKTGKE